MNKDAFITTVTELYEIAEFDRHGGKMLTFKRKLDDNEIGIINSLFYPHPYFTFNQWGIRFGTQFHEIFVGLKRQGGLKYMDVNGNYNQIIVGDNNKQVKSNILTKKRIYIGLTIGLTITLTMIWYFIY